jgi:hypothetical protein
VCVCVCVCVRARARVCCEKAVLFLRCVAKYMGHGAGPIFVLSTISSILHIMGGKNTQSSLFRAVGTGKGSNRVFGA